MTPRSLGPRTLHGRLSVSRGRLLLVEGVFIVLDGSPWEGRDAELAHRAGATVTVRGELFRRPCAPDEDCVEEGHFEYLANVEELSEPAAQP
ncbi:MAG TPA: hypothetical protein VGE42_07360 [Candidatus Dormibacteraeota bacterium]